MVQPLLTYLICAGVQLLALVQARHRMQLPIRSVRQVARRHILLPHQKLLQKTIATHMRNRKLALKAIR